MTNTAYEPSQDFCRDLSKLGVTASWFDPLIGADIVKHLQPNTKIVFWNCHVHHHDSPRCSGDCCRLNGAGPGRHHYDRQHLGSRCAV
ncbi:hypothetical protein ACNKHN_17255 [Shigella flexneri]